MVTIKNQGVGPLLVKLLGLPEGTIWFELRCVVDSVDTVKCAYIPKIPEIIDEELVTLFAEYELVKK